MGSLSYEGRNAKLTLAYDVTDRINYEQQITEFNHILEKLVNERTRDLHEALKDQAALAEELETYNEELMSTNEQLITAQGIIKTQSETKLLHFIRSHR